MHCAVYAGYGANQLRVRAERIGAVFEFETSPLFGAEERAVLVGSHGALPASAVTEDDISDLNPHLTRQEAVEMSRHYRWRYEFLSLWDSSFNRG
jgi:hypothetical protein